MPMRLVEIWERFTRWLCTKGWHSWLMVRPPDVGTMDGGRYESMDWDERCVRCGWERRASVRTKLGFHGNAISHTVFHTTPAPPSVPETRGAD